MKRVLIAGILAILPLVAIGEGADPIDRAVSDTELSPAYAYDQKSHYQSNREYAITSPKGSAQDAIGTRFARSGDEFEILSVKDRKSTYDEVTTGSYERVIYVSKKLERPVVPKEPIGRELLVAVDYRPVEVTVDPPPRRYEAYVAEVRLGSKKTETDRWEYVKVKGTQ